MSLTIEYLDSAVGEESVSVLIGKDILLKFKPQPSVLTANPFLRKVIETPDLLLDRIKLEKLRDLQRLTDEIAESADRSVQFRDTFKSVLTEKDENDEDGGNRYIRAIKKHHDGAVDKSHQISRIEQELNLYLASDHRWYFCKHCWGFLGALESLPKACPACKTLTSKSTEDTESVYRFLQSDVRNYLEGLWFEDYVAKLLKNIGLETWVNCEIMGASGVYHPIDILAIEKKSGKVVICECKRSGRSEHAHRLITQFSDIQCSKAILVSMKKMTGDSMVNLLYKKPGLCLVDGIDSKADSDIEEVLRKEIIEK
ncbi:MAG: restriction endonuclease [Patescibacteria group bacterium]